MLSFISCGHTQHPSFLEKNLKMSVSEEIEKLNEKRRKISNDLKEVDEQISRLTEKKRAKDEKDVPNRPLCELKTKEEVEKLLKVYYDYEKVFVKNKVTLQSAIDNIVFNYNDCQCKVYYNLSTHAFVSVGYSETDSAEKMERYGNSEEWVQVFAK